MTRFIAKQFGKLLMLTTYKPLPLNKQEEFFLRRSEQTHKALMMSGLVQMSVLTIDTFAVKTERSVTSVSSDC